jgi:hypothetical protein
VGRSTKEYVSPFSRSWKRESGGLASWAVKVIQNQEEEAPHPVCARSPDRKYVGIERTCTIEKESRELMRA